MSADAHPRSSPFGDAANTSRKRIEINTKLLFLLVPGRGLQVLDLVSAIKCLHSALSALGLLPKKLPIPIARWDGTAWHLLRSHERAFHFLTAAARSGVPPALSPSQRNAIVGL